MRYIHNLCLHISRTVLRLLGLLIIAEESENKCINHHKNILRRDCTLEVLCAAPTHARDEDDVVEEEQAPVLPAPGAGAGGHHVESDQGPGSRHQVIVGQAVNHNLELPQLLLPSLKKTDREIETFEHVALYLLLVTFLLDS